LAKYYHSADAVAGLAYYLPQFHNLSLRARYDFNRLTDDDFYPFFNNSSFILSAELPFRFGRAQQLALGLITEFSFASDPDPPRRNNYSVYAAYSANLSRSFFISASALIAVRDYYVGDRTDVNELEQHPVGIAVHDARDRAVRIVADRVGAFLQPSFKLGRIGHELPRHRIVRVGAVDQIRHRRRDGDRILGGDLFQRGAFLG
jgi:hypothetical protein